MLAGRPAVVVGAAVLGYWLWLGVCVGYVVSVVSGMWCGGGGSGIILDGAVAACTSWQNFLQTLPPSMTCASLPVSLSPHILRLHCSANLHR